MKLILVALATYAVGYLKGFNDGIDTYVADLRNNLLGDPDLVLNWYMDNIGVGERIAGEAEDYLGGEA